ncbi:hypothetical protein [Pollutimonas subterranea]|uniref:hypothetical protein n=1 Tax=Pollutimonas subterranea TaxID=2045210 RepID=UPI00130443A7|nr:hypothetical protein [Pollutimonas subterranea]
MACTDHADSDGIQAVSQMAAALLCHEAIPESIHAFGVDATTFDMARFRPATP